MCDICKLFLNYPKQIELIGALTAILWPHTVTKYTKVGSHLPKPFEKTFIYTFYVTGIFFVLPCIESYQKVDLRTITLGVPPQEVISSTDIIPSLPAAPVMS